MDKYVFINDYFVKQDKAFLHYSDLSIQRGYGCFDFFRTRDSVPVFIEKHLDRLFRSAEIMHMTIPLSREIVRTVIHELINKNGITDSGIRITVTGGYSPDGYLLTNPNLIVSENPFKELKTSTYKEGIRLAMYPYQRQLPEAKTI